MPKLKTKKSVAKRVKITKKGISRRIMTQNHYLSKMTGRQKQKKRKLVSFNKSDLKNIKKNLPYN